MPLDHWQQSEKKHKWGEIAHAERFTTKLEFAYPPQKECLAESGGIPALALGMLPLFARHGIAID